MGGYKPKAHTRNDPSGSADRFGVPPFDPLGLVGMVMGSICSRCEQTLGRIKYKIRTGFWPSF